VAGGDSYAVRGCQIQPGHSYGDKSYSDTVVPCAEGDDEESPAAEHITVKDYESANNIASRVSLNRFNPDNLVKVRPRYFAQVT